MKPRSALFFLLGGLLAFAVHHARAQNALVVVAIDNCYDDRCSLHVTGDPVPVTVTLVGGPIFDQCRQQNADGTLGAAQPTMPPLGVNNDAQNSTAITVTSPLECHLEFDGTPQNFVGASMTVGEQTIPLADIGGGVFRGSLAPVVTDTARPVELSWIPPTLNESGTPYTDADGYVLYYGTGSGMYQYTERVPDPMETMRTISTLAPNVTYYFAITAINSEATQSELSNEASILTLPRPIAPRPPTDVEARTTAAEEIAYTIFQTTDSLALVPIGTVAGAVDCNEQISVTDINNRLAFMVPKNSVTFLPDTEAELVLAECRE
jgi:hypothetical protein